MFNILKPRRPQQRKLLDVDGFWLLYHVDDSYFESISILQSYVLNQELECSVLRIPGNVPREFDFVGLSRMLIQIYYPRFA